ncbi:MAG: hypothetical protein JXA07_12745 [Spirochaetes bacterium]|nr:hypothetical protein [Spirochaetota bacterium]
MKNELEKLADAMQKLREERLQFVEKILTDRRAENDRIAKIGGTEPVAPALTIADFQLIEDRYNKPLAELREKHRQAEAQSASASLDEIEDSIDAAQAEADEAQRVLDERLNAVKAAEGRLKLARGIIDRAAKPGRKIIFESRLRGLMDKNSTTRQRRETEQKILNY